MKAAGIYFFIFLCATGAEPVLQLSRTVPLPGVKGRIDHLTLDSKAKTLFLAALGNDTVEVIDVAGGKRLRTISGLRKPQGLVVSPTEHELWVTSGGDGEIRVYDCASFQLVKRFSGFPDADNVRRDAKSGRIYAGYGEGGIAIFEGREPAGSIKLPSHPESFQLNEAGSLMYVNLPENRAVAVVDLTSKKVVNRWPMTGAQGNFPLALDPSRNRIFVGCRKPGRLLVLDNKTGRQMSASEICGDTDDLFFDAARRQLYLSCGEGFLDLMQETESGDFIRKERVETGPGARTSYFSPEGSEIYIAVPAHGREPAAVKIYRLK